MTTTERHIEIRYDDGVYVVTPPWSKQPTVLSFEDCHERIRLMCLELIMRGILSSEYMEGMDLPLGSMRAYDTMRNLEDMVLTAVAESGENAVFDLSPQLCDLEGHLVDVTDDDGCRTFVVGHTGGAIPFHQELDPETRRAERRASREYVEVTDLGPVN